MRSSARPSRLSDGCRHIPLAGPAASTWPPPARRSRRPGARYSRAGETADRGPRRRRPQANRRTAGQIARAPDPARAGRRGRPAAPGVPAAGRRPHRGASRPWNHDDRDGAPTRASTVPRRWATPADSARPDRVRPRRVGEPRVGRRAPGRGTVGTSGRPAPALADEQPVGPTSATTPASSVGGNGAAGKAAVADTTAWRYRLEATAPPYWIPFLHVCGRVQSRSLTPANHLDK